MADDPYDRYIESMRSEGLLDEGDRGAAYICDRCGLEGDAPASPTSEHIFCGGRMVPKPHATGTPAAFLIRHPLPGQRRIWQVIERVSGCVISTHTVYEAAVEACRDAEAREAMLSAASEETGLAEDDREPWRRA